MHQKPHILISSNLRNSVVLHRLLQSITYCWTNKQKPKTCTLNARELAQKLSQGINLRARGALNPCTSPKTNRDARKSAPLSTSMLLSKPGMCRQLGCDRLNTVALALKQFANCTHGTGLGSWWQPWGLQPFQEHASQTDTAGSLASLYRTRSFSFSSPHDQPKRKKVHNQGEKKQQTSLKRVVCVGGG